MDTSRVKLTGGSVPVSASSVARVIKPCPSPKSEQLVNLFTASNSVLSAER